MRNHAQLVYSVYTVLVFWLYTSTAYYFNEAPKPGFISVDNGAYTKHGLRGMQRRYFSINRSHNDNIVDSHFNLMKNVPYLMYTVAADSEGNKVTPQLQTEKYKVADSTSSENIPKKEQAPIKPAKENIIKTLNTPIHSMGFRRHTSNSDFSVPDYLTIKYEKNYKAPFQNGHDMLPKPSFVSVNTHENPKPDGPKLALNTNRESAAISLQRPNYIKVSNSNLLAPNTLPEPVTNKRHVQPFENNTHTIKDVTRKAESRKRHVEETTPATKSKAEGIRKYIVGKDKTLNVEREGKEYARIASHEDEVLETDDSPYAIFYRMHPESTLEDHDSYVPMVKEQPTGEANVNKNKRLTEDTEEDNKDKSLLKPDRTVKMHKKIKNLASYRVLDYKK